jgi:hypothetical protein
MKPNLVNGEPSKGTATASARSNVADAVRMLSARSPQESLGLDQSGLLRAFLQATVGCLVVFAALTLGPYFYERAFPTPAKAAKQAPAEEAEAKVPPPAATPPGPNANAKKQDTAKEPDKTLTKKDLPGLLKETGTKTGTPKLADPFSSKIDDLLKN